MKVTWINGTIAPPKSGEYYTAIEALEDNPYTGIKKGDIEIETDYYDTSEERWDSIGRDNPCWKVVCWARILRPDIPDGLHQRVKSYFGQRVGDDE